MFLNKNTGKIWVLIGFEPTKQHVINTSQLGKKFIVQSENWLKDEPSFCILHCRGLTIDINSAWNAENVIEVSGEQKTFSFFLLPGVRETF